MLLLLLTDDEKCTTTNVKSSQELIQSTTKGEENVSISSSEKLHANAEGTVNMTNIDGEAVNPPATAPLSSPSKEHACSTAIDTTQHQKPTTSTNEMDETEACNFIHESSSHLQGADTAIESSKEKASQPDETPNIIEPKDSTATVPKILSASKEEVTAPKTTRSPVDSAETAKEEVDNLVTADATHADSSLSQQIDIDNNMSQSSLYQSPPGFAYTPPTQSSQESPVKTRSDNSQQQEQHEEAPSHDDDINETGEDYSPVSKMNPPIQELKGPSERESMDTSSSAKSKVEIKESSLIESIHNSVPEAATVNERDVRVSEGKISSSCLTAKPDAIIPSLKVTKLTNCLQKEDEYDAQASYQPVPSPKRDNPLVSQFVGFQTAGSNTSIKVSKHSLDQANRLLQESSFLNAEKSHRLSNVDGKEFRIGPCRGVNDFVEAKNTSDLELSKIHLSSSKEPKELTSTGLFQTAGTKRTIAVSDESLEKATKLLQTSTSSLPGIVSSYEHNTSMITASFQTAGLGTTIRVSKESLERANKIMEEKPVSTAKVVNPSTAGLASFQTAGLGTTIRVSKESLERANKIMEEKPVSTAKVVNPSTAGLASFQTAGLGTTIRVSKESLERANKIMEEKPVSTAKVVNPSTAGLASFQTAGLGTTIRVSKESLERANKIMEEKPVSTAESCQSINSWSSLLSDCRSWHYHQSVQGES